MEKRGIQENLNEVTGELSAYDQHPADYGSQLYEREKDMGLLENIENQIELINNALNKLAAGNYGICQCCGKQISLERLNALPYAELCIDCQQDERDKITFGAGDQVMSFNNQNKESTGYDRKDAWHDVAKMGNASSTVNENADTKTADEAWQLQDPQ